MNAELQARAWSYASALKPGDVIDDKTDWSYVAPFFFYLDVALNAHGMRKRRAAGGYVVEECAR